MELLHLLYYVGYVTVVGTLSASAFAWNYGHTGTS